MYSAILLVVGLSIVYGFSTGPPVDTVEGLCVSMDPTGHGPSQAVGEPPYEISVSSTTYGAQATIDVSVTVTDGGKPENYFEGIFVQARRQNMQNANKGCNGCPPPDPTEPMGQFSDPPAGTQLLECGDVNAPNAWGHDNADRKTESTVTWTAPSTDQGPLYFVATIVKGPKQIYWMNVESSLITYSAGKTTGGMVNDEASKYLLWKP